MKFYCATGLDRAAEAAAMIEGLEAAGHECTYNWTKHGSVWSQGPTVRELVALNEAVGVREADVVVVLLPGGRGTHAELGMAIARCTPDEHGVPASRAPAIVLVGEQLDAEGRGCGFYCHPAILRCADVERAATLIGHAQIVADSTARGGPRMPWMWFRRAAEATGIAKRPKDWSSS